MADILQGAAETLRTVRLPDIFNPTRILPSMLGVTAGAVAKMLREGRLGPFIRNGRGYLQRREALLNFLAEQEVSPHVQGRPVPPRARADLVALLSGHGRRARE